MSEWHMIERHGSTSWCTSFTCDGNVEVLEGVVGSGWHSIGSIISSEAAVEVTALVQ